MILVVSLWGILPTKKNEKKISIKNKKQKKNKKFN